MEGLATRCTKLAQVIEDACKYFGLNLTVYDGKIGFVDQKEKKIVALWTPQFTANEIPGGE